MPSSRRKGIDYTPQFGGGIFRPRKVVEEERTALEQDGQERSEEPAERGAGGLEQAGQEAPAEDGVALPPEVAMDVATPAPEQVGVQTKKLANKQARMTISTLASYHDDLIASIRKVVKNPGREVSFVRVSPEEKGQLADIIYTYRRQGQKTSENEINRIAINFLLEDYRTNGEQSILARTLAALRA